MAGVGKVSQVHLLVFNLLVFLVLPLAVLVIMNMLSSLLLGLQRLLVTQGPDRQVQLELCALARVLLEEPDPQEGPSWEDLPG
jgi:hypothetical protein